MGRHKPDILSVIRDGIDVSIPEIMQDAAAEIERLRAENERLTERLLELEHPDICASRRTMLDDDERLQARTPPDPGSA